MGTAQERHKEDRCSYTVGVDLTNWRRGLKMNEWLTGGYAID